MATTLNYYELLDLEARQYEPLLSLQEVKAAYRRALLQHHPDKNPSRSVRTENASQNPSTTVDDIALAYKVLSEPPLRAEYDRWLRSNDLKRGSGSHDDKTRYTGLETVDLDDLVFDELSGLWSRGCRCGDEKGYIVSEAELERNVEDGELIVGCKGCSLWLRVLFGTEE